MQGIHAKNSGGTIYWTRNWGGGEGDHICKLGPYMRYLACVAQYLC